MLSEIHKAHTETAWLQRCAWAVLVLGLLASLVGWQRAADELQTEADTQFAQQASEALEHLGQQTEHYLDLLSGFQAMFLVSDDVGRVAFHTQYERLRVDENYPALIAAQYAELVPDVRKGSFEAAVRADRSMSAQGYPRFAIHPPGPRPAYLVTKYSEPARHADSHLGQDMALDAASRAAMERARDTGRPLMSPPMRVTTPDGQMVVGFAARAPVYLSGTDLDTFHARRAAYTGEVRGVFRAAPLIREVLERQSDMHLRLQVFDVGPFQSAPSRAPRDARPSQLLFDGHHPALQPASLPARPDAGDVTTRTLSLAGRQWEMVFTRAPVNAARQPYPLALLLGGSLGAVLLWWSLRSAASRHHHAASMALRLSRQAVSSERRLRSVIDHTIDGILSINREGFVLSANQAMCRIFGYTEQEIVGHHLRRLLPAAGGHGSSPIDHIDHFLEAQSTGADGVGRRTEGRRAHGERFPLDLAISTMEVEGQTQYIGILRDLSAQQNAEQAIVEAQRQLNEVDEMRRVIVHHAPYAIFLLNPQGVIQTVNPAGEALLGYRSQELVGKATTQRFFDPDQVLERAHLLALRLNQPVEELNVLQHLAKESPGLPAEWSLLRADHRPLVAEITVTVLTDEVGHLTGYLAMAHDVTSRRDAETQLQHMAMHDALTALPNRNMLQEQLKSCLNQAERGGHTMAMMFLDLDRFKKINDSLGHHVGDSVLIEVARRLRTSMRTSDIVARLGGDEFVVLLPRIATAQDGERVAQKVIDEFIEPLRVGPHELRVTPSIGLAIYPQHGADSATLMRHADLAMYQAKSNGRHRVQMYSEKMESPTADTLVLENELYKALERDELRVHYQPQFDCASGAITGAEALVRWEHGGKLVPPADFIPLAEESGLIVAMGEWVLRRACEQAQQWRERSGWPIRIAVNLSAVQLDQPDLVDTVARVLRDTRLPATALELEITESVVVRESLRAADVLTELRALGVSIAIDDFGVGYSSFAYLRELPVDRFKLDRSFLMSVPQSSGDSRLTAALIAMAHRLEVGIVAEGVETAEQAAFLKDHGCDECQGYFLARPMKDVAFEELLMTHSRQHLAAVAAVE